ncbi:MAG: galactose-1-phosphate uridylyltransferase [Anaerolineae bacterium]|nr:galactose-1-phosphate uridylyltransferase [Anaerolineae bacterium]
MGILDDYPHRRYNPLTGEYVVVSPHRTKRPWQGQTERPTVAERPQYDPTCYLCPGNVRANGEHNPHYTDTFVFTNDFAALLPDAPALDTTTHPLLRAEVARGTSRVLCFSPRHDLTLALMDKPSITRVVPHPHGQIWACDFLPNEVAAEDRNQRDYLERTGATLLLDYANLEVERGERVVAQNEDWVVVVPYWAVWPFETMVLPRFPVKHLPDLTPAQRVSLADALKSLLVRYDNLFEVSFPYSMGWHGAPTQGDTSGWQLHAHFYPPLLRSASVRKFMVGFELLAEAQRDLTPEQAADRLRALPDTHYSER